MKKLQIILLLLVSTFVFAQPKAVIKTLKSGIKANVNWALEQEPRTVTVNISERSAGGIHDFYSEGDYWWPDPENQASLISEGTEKLIQKISQPIDWP